MVSQYLITPPALYDDPPVDDFAGPQLPVNGGDEPWAQQPICGKPIGRSLCQCEPGHAGHHTNWNFHLGRPVFNDEENNG